ncbi:MAG: rpoE 3, partial [Phycisphaerales bacterium]|nr:rpoE 3 [Phycisphaerales bacterium]
MTHRPPPPPKTAEDLLLEFERTGDPVPFEEVVRRYSGMVYGVCYRVTRNAHDAEDATQAAFLKLATYVRSAAGVPRVGPWLQQVAKTTAVDLRRSRTRRQTREQAKAAITEQEKKCGHPADDASMDELKQMLRDEVDRLPVHYRTPLVLYYFGGLSTEQIAVELKSNAKALAVRLFRARKMLGGRLRDRGIVGVGGPLVCLSVADAIVAGLANAVYAGPPAQAASAAWAGGSAVAGGSGSGASAWLTSHSAVVAGLSNRISATLRACAVGTLAGHGKALVPLLLLSTGTALAGSTDAVRNSAAVRAIDTLLHDLKAAVGGLGRAGSLFRQSVPRLRVDATPSPAGQGDQTLGRVPVRVPVSSLAAVAAAPATGSLPPDPYAHAASRGPARVAGGTVA